MRITLLFIISILWSTLLLGQEVSTTSRKAKKYYEEASYHLTYGQYHEAEEKLEKALNADPQFYEAYLLLGDLHRDLNEFKTSIGYYNKAVEINPDQFPRIHYFLGKLQIQIGDYENAEISFKKFVEYEDTDAYSKKDAERNILSCQFAKEALLNPVEFSPINLGKNINSMYSEYFPCMTVDGNMILYTRLLGEPGHHQQEDFYISIKNNGNWVPSQNLGGTINTQMNEGAATISADGKTIIFTACEQFGVYGPNRQGYGSCDLFFTRRLVNKWSQPTNLGPPINTANWESQPSLSSDGETLYFVRGVTTNNRRESDIFVTKLDKEGYWSKPEKMSSNINTEEAEGSVFIHPDNSTLYFSSNGHVGMGGSDLFMSKRNEFGEWGPAKNLGYPINTFNDENSLLVGPDGEIGYFASNRTGGFGELDIYGFNMPEEIQANPVTYFKGIVYDSLSKNLLTAKIELIDAETSQKISETFSNPNNGSFFLTLIPQHDYVINVSKDNYLFYSDAIFIKGNFERLKPYIKNIPLLPLEVGNSVVLKNIFFETDKSQLKPESKTELGKLVDFLNKYETIFIEIGGHTDNEGSYEYNQKLSEERAQAVYNYLITAGIDPVRLEYKGYSFDKPIETNDTDEGRALNRRTEFIIKKL